MLSSAYPSYYKVHWVRVTLSRRPQVVPYTECFLGMEPQAFTQSVLAPKLFTEKVCSQGKKVSFGRIDMKVQTCRR